MRHSRLSHVAVSMFTVLYIPLLASCLIMPLTFNGHPVAHAIMLVFMPALSDTGGLFAGAWLGKHKLSPRISPKKSWEGLAGSILFAMAGSFVVMFWHLRAIRLDGSMVGAYCRWFHDRYSRNLRRPMRFHAEA